MPDVLPTTHPIAAFLARTRLAPRQAHGALALWPLCRREAAASEAGEAYVSLGEAIARGSLVVDEVHEGGSVPHVLIHNDGGVAVLVLFGEEIRGAKQNRVANASFLVPARSHVVIDVSCVEAGRWHRARGSRFHAAHEVISSSLRRKMALNVETARRSGARFDADQGAVWREIDARLDRTHTESHSRAYADYRATRASDLEALEAAFRPLDGQVGFVACIGGDVAGVEAIGRPEVFRAEFGALLRAYAIDTIDAGLVRELDAADDAWRDAPRFGDPEPLLDALARAVVESGPSLGEGSDLRLRGDGVAGCALAHGDLVHLTAFPSAS